MKAIKLVYCGAMSYIKINDLSLSFKEQIIFNKASLTIDSPGFYCLMGRN